jgi:hypothetical protein
MPLPPATEYGTDYEQEPVPEDVTSEVTAHVAADVDADEESIEAAAPAAPPRPDPFDELVAAFGGPTDRARDRLAEEARSFTQFPLKEGIDRTESGLARRTPGAAVPQTDPASRPVETATPNWPPAPRPSTGGRTPAEVRAILHRYRAGLQRGRTLVSDDANPESTPQETADE